MNAIKPVASLVDQAAVTASHMAAARQQMLTRPMQEVKETIMREVLTSEKVQDALGKILNKIV